MKLFKKTAYRLVRKILYSGYFGDINLNQCLYKHLSDTMLTYIDVGAFDGVFFDALFAEKKVQSSILIEPQKDLYDKLKLKYETNSSIKIHNSLLSNKVEDRTFHINKLGATSSVFEFNTQLMENQLDITVLKKETIATSTLDKLLSSKGTIVDLLKIDVQGSELLVLEGAENILKKTQFIFLEVSFKKIYNEIPTFEEIYCWLNKRGFELLEIIPDYRNKKGELLQANCLFKNINL